MKFGLGSPIRFGILLTVFGSVGCAHAPATATSPVPSSCAEPWDDAATERWLQAHRDSLILIVSDGMPYSQQSVGIVENEARHRDVALQVISDRPGPGQGRRCDPILQSNRLISRGALRHFPTLFIVREHTLTPRVIPGIQGPAELTLTLDEFLR